MWLECVLVTKFSWEWLGRGEWEEPELVGCVGRCGVETWDVGEGDVAKEWRDVGKYEDIDL